MKISEPEERALTTEQAKKFALELSACPKHNLVYAYTGDLRWCDGCLFDTLKEIAVSMQQREHGFVPLFPADTEAHMAIQVRPVMPVQRITINFTITPDGGVAL